MHANKLTPILNVSDIQQSFVWFETAPGRPRLSDQSRNRRRLKRLGVAGWRSGAGSWP